MDRTALAEIYGSNFVSREIRAEGEGKHFFPALQGHLIALHGEKEPSSTKSINLMQPRHINCRDFVSQQREERNLT